MRWLTDPFGSSFMVRATVGVVALGVAGPLAGCWIVLRRLAYLSDATTRGPLSHALFGNPLTVSL